MDLEKTMSIQASSEPVARLTKESVLHLSLEDRARLERTLGEQEYLEYLLLLKEARWEQGGTVPPEYIIRPRHLYHASARAGIALFEPRAEKKRNPNDPPQIFATPSRVVATMFLVPSDDSFVISGSYDSGRTWTYIIGDEERFRAQDVGGWVYTLPGDSFAVDPNIGLGVFEWTSQQLVAPERADEFPSGIRAMLEAGVKVYIVDKNTFATLRAPGVDHTDVLQGLVPVSGEYGVK